MTLSIPLVFAQTSLPDFTEMVEAKIHSMLKIRESKAPKRQYKRIPGCPFLGEWFLKHVLAEETGYHSFSPPRPLSKDEDMSSGVIISKDGKILTFYKEKEEPKELEVEIRTGEIFKGEVMERDEITGITLIKIDASRDLPEAILGDSDKLRLGDWLIAIGNPFGLEYTVTQGIISAIGRLAAPCSYDNFIWIDTPLNHGYRGSPLFNMKGEVVGINTSFAFEKESMSFIIPINYIKKMWPNLEK